MIALKDDDGSPDLLPVVGEPGALRKILERAAMGDPEILPVVRKLFDRDQERGGGLAKAYGDIYEHARTALLRAAAGDDLAVQEAMARTIDRVRDDLAGADPSALELILCGRIALTWFDVNEMDRRSAIQPETYRMAEYMEDRRDRANRRFLAACKALASVRKLALPALQINVGRQQVNIAGSGDGGGDLPS